MRVLTAWLFVLCPVTAFAESPGRVSWLEHLKQGELPRLEAAVGDANKLPFYQVDLTADPKGQRVNGHLTLDAEGALAPRGRLYLRVAAEALNRGAVQLSKVRVNGKPVSLEEATPGLLFVTLDRQGPIHLELELEAAVPRIPPGKERSLGVMGVLQPSARGATDHGAFSANSAGLSLVGVVPMVPPLDEAGKPWPGPNGIGDLALFAPANYVVRVSVPQGYQAFAPGVLGDVSQTSNGRRYTYSAAAARDCPIFVTEGRRVLRGAVGSVVVEVAFADRDAQLAATVLEETKDALRQYEKHLGPYPWSNLRVVEMPLTDGAGGMEFPGLFTLSTALVEGGLHPEQLIPDEMRGLLGAGLGGMGGKLHSLLGSVMEFTVAHETAHQYFPMLVGSDPIREPVADESLAQAVSLLYFEWQHGAAAAQKMRDEQLATAYQLYRMSGEDAPADRATNAFDTELQYGALVYGKAPLLYEAERKLVGDGAFFTALRKYVEDYRYRWGCAACLTREVAKASPSDVERLDGLRRRWWKERHGDEDLGAFDMSKMMMSLVGDALSDEQKALLQQLGNGRLPGLDGR
jgi:hypothetical protein